MSTREKLIMFAGNYGTLIDLAMVYWSQEKGSATAARNPFGPVTIAMIEDIASNVIPFSQDVQIDAMAMTLDGPVSFTTFNQDFTVAFRPNSSNINSPMITSNKKTYYECGVRENQSPFVNWAILYGCMWIVNVGADATFHPIVPGYAHMDDTSAVLRGKGQIEHWHYTGSSPTFGAITGTSEQFFIEYEWRFRRTSSGGLEMYEQKHMTIHQAVV